MPDEKKGKEVDKYGEADEKEALPGYEQKQWEEKHTAAGTLKSGNQRFSFPLFLPQTQSLTKSKP